MDDNETRCDLLFVYGTLRHGCDNEKARTLTKMAEWLCTARTDGQLWNVDWYPALTKNTGRGDSVLGDVFRLTDPQTGLAMLDTYEECTADFPQPWEYRREIITVEGPNGSLRVWAYLYNRPVEGLDIIEGGDWLSHIARAPVRRPA